MDELEVKALAVADRLDATHDATYLERDRLRLVLALAWLEGYGYGLTTGKRITDDTLERLAVELTS